MKNDNQYECVAVFGNVVTRSMDLYRCGFENYQMKIPAFFIWIESKPSQVGQGYRAYLSNLSIRKKTF